VLTLRSNPGIDTSVTPVDD